MRKRGAFPGMICLRVSGAEPWRFLARCAREGVILGETAAEDDFTCLVWIRPGDLPTARKLAARCGCALETVTETGLAPVVRRVRRRLALAAGAAVLFAALYAASLFVWDIRVTENDSSLPDTEILRVLAEQGVGVGSFWPSFRGERIRSRALEVLPGLSWLAVNVRGGRAEVEVRASVPPPEIWDEKMTAGVTASRAGVVESVRTLAGDPLVRRGDAVTPGQVLIRSTARDPHARGEIRAYTYYEMAASAPLTALEKETAGAGRRRYALILGQRRINFYADSGILPSGCDKIIHVWQLRAENAFALPVRLVRETWVPCTLRDRPEDPEKLRAALEALLTERLSRELEDRGEIRHLAFTASSSGELLTVTLRAECLERIDRDTPAAVR